MARRALDFHSMDEIIADLNNLRANGYTKTGNWDLAQACNHLSLVVRGSLEGFSGDKVAWPIRVLAPVILWWVFKKRYMPEGAKAPKEFLPKSNLDEKAEVEDLKGLLARFRDHKGALHPSPFAGALSYEKWTNLHEIHCAHHLSFLLPSANEKK